MPCPKQGGKKNLLGGIILLFAGGLLLAQFVLAAVTGNILPSANGTYSQWSTLNGTILHSSTVDEYTCNGQTDYNYTNTIGTRDSYRVNLKSVPDGSAITAIEIKPCASQNLTGESSSIMKVFYRLNGINSINAGNYLLNGTIPSLLATTKFNGLSMTKTATTTLEIGTVLSSGDKGARLSQIITKITYTPLAVPTDLKASNLSANSNYLSWTDNSTNEDGFKIERSLNSQYGPFSQAAVLPANSTTSTDTGLTADQTYYYRVRAFNSGANSGSTNIAYAITTTAVPNKPTNLTATASSSTIIINWTDNSTNEVGFKIERGLDHVNFSQIAIEENNSTNYLDLNLLAGTYYYRIRSFNNLGDSIYSNTASTTLP